MQVALEPIKGMAPDTIEIKFKNENVVVNSVKGFGKKMPAVYSFLDSNEEMQSVKLQKWEESPTHLFHRDFLQSQTDSCR